MDKPLQVLLVEDTWAEMEALSGFLAKNGMTVLPATSKEGALAILKDTRPDVAVLDLNLPERDGEEAEFGSNAGIDIAKQLRSQYPTVGIVFSSNFIDRGPEVIRFSQSGHDRIVFLAKTSPPRDMLKAIHKVASQRGGLEISEGIQLVRKSAYDLAMETLQEDERAIVLMALENVASLSEAEWRVFEAVGHCRTRDQAAKALVLSAKAVSSHLEHIYAKLQLPSLTSGVNHVMLLAKIHLLHHLRSQGEPQIPPRRNP
jgi:DNA-binding NarL/FixJ family response regulator